MPTPPYPLHPEPLKKSWLERRPLWKIPLGCLTLFLLIGIFGSIVMTIITTSFHNSDVYKLAVAKAIENSQVRDAIGEPIHPAWLVSGQLNVTGSTGNANLLIPISGPRGSGSIRAVASKNRGVWRFSDLQVNIKGRSEPIDLLSIQPPPERDF
jgi:Cytochrome oxidase complex assembly protein 1